MLSEMGNEFDLERFRIPGLPDKSFYIPNLITEAEEEYVLQEISRLPRSKWTVLTHRRLLSLPSQLTGQAKDTLLASQLPAFLTRNIDYRIRNLEIFAGSPHQEPNHCLVNEYEPGQGIMPHTDGPAYFPVTATVSLASHTVLEIYEKNEQGERNPAPTWRILQEPRSLLVTTADMYRDTLHGISELESDEKLDLNSIANWDLLGDTIPYETGIAARQTRISLTYRDVLKVAKLGGALKFMNKK